MLRVRVTTHGRPHRDALGRICSAAESGRRVSVETPDEATAALWAHLLGDRGFDVTRGGPRLEVETWAA